MTRTLVIFLPLITLLFSACKGTTAPAFEEFGRQTPVPGGAYTDVTVAELQAMLAEKDFTFVNVHIPYEGEIASTDLFIPYDEIEQNLGQLPADKGAKIVLYCRSDRMSRIAAEKLVSLGYSNVWNLEGGMVAWEQAGLPLYR
ncbi:MAG: rhodanese-like domain-containing protein [Anaerolineales bacterium]|nr:rhodanese-like domain-containing protein [Anaerolineales bacterium]